jgi:hypothetical protein
MSTKKKPVEDKKEAGYAVIPFKWIHQYADQARKYLGIGEEWKINFSKVDKIDDNPNTQGRCFANSVYLFADIELANSLSCSGIETELVVYHELGHVAHSEIDRIVEKIIEQAPAAKREFLVGLYSDSLERYIQRQAKALVRIPESTE